MALFPAITAAPLVAVAGMECDLTAARETITSETAIATASGICVSQDANGRAVAGTGAKVLGWTVVDLTKLGARRANELTPVLRKGRIYAVLAGGATAPVHGAQVSVNAAGEVVSAAGTAVIGATGYQKGTKGPNQAMPAGLCLIELNLPQVA